MFADTSGLSKSQVESALSFVAKAIERLTFLVGQSERWARGLRNRADRLEHDLPLNQLAISPASDWPSFAVIPETVTDLFDTEKRDAMCRLLAEMGELREQLRQLDLEFSKVLQLFQRQGPVGFERYIPYFCRLDRLAAQIWTTIAKNCHVLVLDFELLRSHLLQRQDCIEAASREEHERSVPKLNCGWTADEMNVEARRFIKSQMQTGGAVTVRAVADHIKQKNPDGTCSTSTASKLRAYRAFLELKNRQKRKAGKPRAQTYVSDSHGQGRPDQILHDLIEEEERDAERTRLINESQAENRRDPSPLEPDPPGKNRRPREFKSL